MGIFAADRGFLGEIGGLDGGMTVYGGENVELGIRVSNQKLLKPLNLRVLLIKAKHFYPCQTSRVSTAQVWLCGGSVEVVPCSRVAHIERAYKPYAPDLDSAMRRNALRVAEIWMDDYKRNVLVAWNLPLKVQRK